MSVIYRGSSSGVKVVAVIAGGCSIEVNISRI